MHYSIYLFYPPYLLYLLIAENMRGVVTELHNAANARFS